MNKSGLSKITLVLAGAVAALVVCLVLEEVREAEEMIRGNSSESRDAKVG